MSKQRYPRTCANPDCCILFIAKSTVRLFCSHKCSGHFYRQGYEFAKAIQLPEYKNPKTAHVWTIFDNDMALGEIL